MNPLSNCFKSQMGSSKLIQQAQIFKISLRNRHTKEFSKANQKNLIIPRKQSQTYKAKSIENRIYFVVAQIIKISHKKIMQNKENKSGKIKS